MAVRYDSSTDSFSNPDVPREVKPEAAPAAPSAQHPRSVVRVLYNTEDGSTRVMESHQTGGVVTPSVDKASARDRAGNPISLSAAGPNDVVTINGSDTLASVWESMGMLRRTATGYETVGEAASPAAGNPKPNEPTKAEAEPAGDVRGVEPTLPSTDATMKALADQSPMGVEAIVTSLSTTGDIPDSLLSDLASQHDGDPEEFKAGVVAAVQDHVRAAQQAIRNVDPTISPEAFQAWLLRDPDLANKVTRDVMAKSVAEVQRAARQYSTARDTALEAALDSRGITTKREGGKLYVSRTSLGLPVTKRGDFAGDLMPVSQAIREGHIIINEVK